MIVYCITRHLETGLENCWHANQTEAVRDAKKLVKLDAAVAITVTKVDAPSKSDFVELLNIAGGYIHCVAERPEIIWRHR